MSELQVHLALIRENWDRHDHWFDALCNNLVRGHMKELEALVAQSPPPVSEGVEEEARDVWHCPPMTDFSTADGTKPNLSCSWCNNRVPITHYGLCNECLDESPLSSPSRGCDAGEDYGPGSPWSEGYNSGFAAGSREPPRGCDLDMVEACAKVAEEHAETKFGPDEPESIEEWRRGFVAASETIAAAIRNLGKETREGEG